MSAAVKHKKRSFNFRYRPGNCRPNEGKTELVSRSNLVRVPVVLFSETVFLGLLNSYYSPHISDVLLYAPPRPCFQHEVSTERDARSGVTVTDAGHAQNSTSREQEEDETSAQAGKEKPPDDFHDVVGGGVGGGDDGGIDGGVDGGIDDVVDTQTPRRPSPSIRVYGSSGITRVRRSVGDWLSQRWPTL